MSIKRVIYQLYMIILSPLHTIIIFVRKMHPATSSSDVSDMMFDNIIAVMTLCGADIMFNLVHFTLLKSL